MKTHYIILLAVTLQLVNTYGHCNIIEPEILIENLPDEDIHIHTDKDIYFAGDRLFFKVYLLNNPSGRGAKASKIIYLSLVDTTGGAVSTLELNLVNGTASGSIPLPDTLKTCFLNLVGWTNKMLIDGISPFSKQLMTVNRFDNGITGFIKSSRANPDDLHEYRKSDYYTRFITVDKEKYGIKISPKHDDSSFIIIMLNDENLVELTLEDPSDIDKIWHISISDNDNIIWEKRVHMNGVRQQYLIDPADLNHGLLALTVLDADKAELLTIEWVNLAGVDSINLKTDKRTYGRRERVNVTFDKSSLSSTIASASLSVTRAENILINSPGITTSFSHTAKYTKWNPEEAAFFLTTEGVFPGRLLLNLPVEYPENQPEMVIIPEISGPVVNGRILTAANNTPVKDATVFLTAVDSIVNLKYSITKADGSFYFLLDEYYRGKNIYLTVYNAGDHIEDYRIVIRDKFVPLPFTPRKILTHKNIFDFIEEAITVKRIQQAYGTDHYNIISDNTSRPYYSLPLVYRTPSHRVKTGNYQPLENFTEIANEIVPNLRIRGRRDDPVPVMICSRTKTYLPGAPTFFMNGVYMPDTENIFGLSSENITSVEVLSIPWSFGNLTFNGVVGIFNSENPDVIPYNEKHTIIQGSPLRREIKFNPLRYTEIEKYNSSLPDLRETLFWEPEIRLKNGIPTDISFYTGDLAGEFSVMVEGLTKSGEPFSEKILITVK